MFCPGCGCEYREGVAECAECHIPLTAEPPTRQSSAQQEYVEHVPVLTTNNIVDVALIRDALAAEGIHSFYDSEMLHNFDMLFKSPRIWVEKDKVARAMEIIEDLKQEHRAIDDTETWEEGDEPEE